MVNFTQDGFSLHKAIIDASEVAIISTTQEGIIISFNPAAERLLGYAAAELIGKETMEIFHDREEILQTTNELNEQYGLNLKPGFETFVANIKDNKGVNRSEWTLVRKDKSRIPVLLSINVLADNEGNVLGYAAIATDISEQKNFQHRLEESEGQLLGIFNNSLCLTALISFDGTFKNLNPAWEKTLGWTKAELLSGKITDFAHPDDVQKTQDVLTYISSGHTVASFESRYRCRDGSYRWLLWASYPDIAKQVIYTSAIDITSRKKSEEELINSKRNLEAAAFELEEQNRQLDEFAHIISHNLRAPVHNIKALLGFINETSRPEDYQLIFEKIKNVTFNISETMNELMETIKIKKNSELERVEIRFKDILDKVIQSLEGELIESGATVTYNFNNAPKIYYSKPYMESIFQNLISNAIKYRSPTRIPEIFLSTDIVMTGIELRVQDNGLGIDLEKFGNKLFGLHKTFHENTEARGVGLFLTKTQIEALGGSITAESEVDKGTTFIIHF
ncbi:MAG TPA: PAS domain-containing sensor histidine kinase [Ohtaekwangia sp.]|nr:PAS domain-containing sensor histidine kinase [Ohtaekwangia sp.]